MRAHRQDSGFGRMAILEVLPATDALRDQILHDTSAKVIMDLARKEGMKTLQDVGMDKARAGLTSLDEVLRVTGDKH